MAHFGKDRAASIFGDEVSEQVRSATFLFQPRSELLNPYLDCYIFVLITITVVVLAQLIRDVQYRVLVDILIAVCLLAAAMLSFYELLVFDTSIEKLT